MTILGVLLSLAIGVGAVVGQAPSQSARAAALRFAIENGLVMPPGPRALALESDYQVFHPYAPPKTAEDQSKAADALAREFAVGRIQGANNLLRCVKGRCVPSAYESVIIINEPEPTESDISVMLRVYLTSDKPLEYDGRLALAVVEVAERGGGWVGVRYKWPLVIVPIRLDGK